MSSDAGPGEGIQGLGNTSPGTGAQRPSTALAGAVCNTLCNAIDADEEALEAKMIAADLAGNTTLAKAYERRLERLRAGKAAGNVLPFEARRRGGR